MMRSLQSLLIVSTALGCGLRSPADAGELNEELMWRAPAIIDYLQQQEYDNVGVLKFRVKRGDEPASDSVGEINSLIAQRLELALVLANPPQKERQVGIIRDASAMAAMIAGADHHQPDGQLKLLSQTYPLAWDAARVKPDAMLTGLLIVADDLSSIEVRILAFDERGGGLHRVIPTFTATADGLTWGELGESYLASKEMPTPSTSNVAITSPPIRNKLVVQQALRVKRTKAPFPLLDPDAPVGLRILYDGVPVPIDVQDGRAYVREPNEGERVTFELSHQGPADETYGVVLKVNGQNTLYRQWWRASECAKWVLAPGSEPIVIRGFQETAGQLSEFRVLSPDESRAGEVRYGKDTGQISLNVFRQRTGPTPTPELLDDGAEDLMAITRGTYPEGQADNLFALKSRLLAGTVMPVRGLIEGGDQRASARTETPFEADPTPVLSATITYYAPQE